jgi:hypothetical protein
MPCNAFFISRPSYSVLHLNIHAAVESLDWFSDPIFLVIPTFPPITLYTAPNSRLLADTKLQTVHVQDDDRFLFFLLTLLRPLCIVILSEMATGIHRQIVCIEDGSDSSEERSLEHGLFIVKSCSTVASACRYSLGWR